jgi:hypothetical protein
MDHSSGSFPSGGDELREDTSNLVGIDRGKLCSCQQPGKWVRIDADPKARVRRGCQ